MSEAVANAELAARSLRAASDKVVPSESKRAEATPLPGIRMRGSGLASATSARSGSKLWLRPADSPIAKNRRHSHGPRPAYGIPFFLKQVSEIKQVPAEAPFRLSEAVANAEGATRSLRAASDKAVPSESNRAEDAGNGASYLSSCVLIALPTGSRSGAPARRGCNNPVPACLSFPCRGCALSCPALP